MTALSNPDFFPEGEAHFVLSGPAGRLEVMTTCPKDVQAEGVAVVCHPHPLQEGAMTNKVVFTTAKAFDKLGIRTVRFNFRGVGQSQGTFADTVGETDDLMAIVGWIQKVLNPKALWLSGFSFGAYIAAYAAQKVQVQQLITIGPGVVNYPFDKIGKIQAPWLMIHGELDEVALAKDAQEFTQSYQVNPIDLHLIEGASHFFHGKLIELRTILEQHILLLSKP